jgi:hypothetical protein
VFYAFNALRTSVSRPPTSRNVWRSDFSLGRADGVGLVAELSRCAGKQFDGERVAALARVLGKAEPGIPAGSTAKPEPLPLGAAAA